MSSELTGSVRSRLRTDGRCARISVISSSTYSSLRRAGQPSYSRRQRPGRASQTPLEFYEALDARLTTLAEKSTRWQRMRHRLQPDLQRLARLFISQQYGPEPPSDPDQGFWLWARLRRPLWLLRWRHRWLQRRRR